MAVDNSTAGHPDQSTGALPNHQLAFSMRGIDRSTGCMVVVRPDQHVGQVLPPGDRQGQSDYFAGTPLVRA
jgi:hypothetical protein